MNVVCAREAVRLGGGDDRRLPVDGRPILWILHAAYVWLAIGFALLALAVGAIGGLIIGMVTRTARGHTGRALQASKAEVLAYTFVLSAAVLRALLPIAAPQ